MSANDGLGPYPRADGYIGFSVGGRTKLAHVLVAERALGKPLPAGAQVHHWDGDRSNNEPTNLVVCPSQSYHRLLHLRMAAFEACGNPDWLQCRFCHAYAPAADLYVAPNQRHAYHRECSANYARAHRAKLRMSRAAS